jgi:hypothetical protein
MPDNETRREAKRRWRARRRGESEDITPDERRCTCGLVAGEPKLHAREGRRVCRRCASLLRHYGDATLLAAAAEFLGGVR